MTKKYRFHWKDGDFVDGMGTTPEEALRDLGFGQGSVGALDYWEILEEEEVS
jgi:hypothetical protein